MTDAASIEPSLTDETHGLARHASIIALGNVASRGLGFVREFVKSRLFGTGPQVDALNLAIAIPLQIYDLVTGGLVNSALVPAFSEYTPPERRAELWRLASILLTLATLLISALLLGLMWFAPQVVAVYAFIGALAGGQTHPESLETASRLLRITLPAVVFLSLSGILTGLLYALRRFTLPAFTAAIFNASIIGLSLLLAARFGVTAMALGLLAGSVLQVALQLPALRDGLLALRPLLTLHHPGLRRILKAYVPIIVSLLVNQVGVNFGLSVAFGFENGLSWMGYATNLYQFPLGLVGVAVSAAILPTLAGQANQVVPGDYKATLVRGINLVLVLMIPATVGMFLLAQPIVALAFQGGKFLPEDTLMTAWVLQWFLFGLSFAAVDLLLINAFYARHDTLTPSSVGVLTIVVYVATVFVTRPWLGLFSLMLADSIKQILHASVTGVLLSRRIGGFARTGLWATLGKIVLAALVMGLGVVAARWAVEAWSLPLAALMQTIIPGAVGVILYFLVAAWLNIAEVRLALGILRRRLRI
jgi:putative peptidoglycan lipid II flippase